MRSQKEILEIMQIFARENPHPQCELKFHNLYTLLIAVVLSAQSTDKGVNKATAELFKVADTPQKMLDLGEDKLKQYIKIIGLFNNKAKNIIALSKQLVADFGGVVPDNRDTLTTLAGVGRKTANLVLGDAFGKPSIVVDTHCIRLTNRIGLTKNKDPEKIEKDLGKILPPEESGAFCHRLVLHGRAVCTARKPKCDECALKFLCDFYVKY